VKRQNETVKAQLEEIARLKASAPTNSGTVVAVQRIRSDDQTLAADDRCLEGSKDDWADFFVSPEVMNNGQLLCVSCLYGYLLLLGGNMIGDGSELLLLVPSWAGLIGSVVLPILGAVPDGLMVLFSGMGANAATKISVGIGALAGSTIMLLTIPWYLAILGGRVDIVGHAPQYRRPKFAPEDWSKLSPDNLSWDGTGVGVSGQVGENAITMILSCLLYFVMQGPCMYFSFTNISAEKEGAMESYFALAGMVLCTAAFCYYLKLQMNNDDDEVVQQKTEEVRVAAIKSGDMTLRGVMKGIIDEVIDSGENGDTLTEALLDQDSKTRKKLSSVLMRFYGQYDANRDQRLDFEELRCIMTDLREQHTADEMQELFIRFDADKTGYIEFGEFVNLMMDYLIRMTRKDRSDMLSDRPKSKTAVVLYSEDDDEDGDDEEEIPEDLANLSPEEQQYRIKLRAFTTMGIGTALVTLFSDPMTDCLAEWGARIGVSPFYIAFVVAPLASNSAELIAAYNYALKKTCRSMTISLCALEGAAVMNNTFCLGTFYFVIWLNDLPWTFTAETVSILAVQFAVGIIALQRVQPYRNAVYVLTLYPLSLCLVYVLENVYGID
jgi:Ca2+/Na+ antiporter